MHATKVFILIFFIGLGARAQRAVPNEWVVQVSPKKLQGFTQLKKFKLRKINQKMAVFTAKTREELLKIEGVEKVEPNYIYEMAKSPNDPLYSSLWGLHNAGQKDSSGTRGSKGIDLDIENAWNISTGSKKVIVAVIDTGVDFTIPDLKNNAWINQAEANGLKDVDDDKNGYVDDIHGYNFVSNKGDSTDDNGHGSHCSGTIGAQGNDHQGVVGINWDVSIMAVKFISSDGTGTLENAVKAIDYARKNGAQIMSNSWGGLAESAILQQAVVDANAAGILFVAAAGNNGADNDRAPFYPASYKMDNVIAVGAINNRARLSSFSNFGPETVQIAAPGENILSTTPQGFETMSGTSMAAPHVAGVAALLLSVEPQLTAAQLKTRIVDTARPLFRLKNRVMSGGMIDAYAALSNQKPGPDLSDPNLLPTHQASSLASAHPYPMNSAQVFTLKVPGAKRIAFHFSRFETEPNFDYVEVLDPVGRSYDKLSGFHSDEYSEIIEGDTILLHFTSDKSVNGYGFDIDQIFFE